MPTETEQRAAVVAEALSWQGTRYHHRARIKGAGVDCGMLLAEVYERAGVIPHVDPGMYSRDWMCHRDEERYLAFVETYAKRIPGPPQPGDIVLYRYEKCISHAAIVIEWPQVLHAYAPVLEVVLDDGLANADLMVHFVGFWSPWGGDL